VAIFSNSREYAFETMRELLEAHRAAVDSMRIVSQSSAMLDELVVAMQMHHKFKPEDTPGEYKRRAAATVSWTKNLVSSGFAYQRGMLLVALCGLLDVTVRKVVAECLIADHTLIGKLPDELRLLRARDGGKKRKDEELLDDLFSIVDRQFKNFPANGAVGHTARTGAIARQLLELAASVQARNLPRLSGKTP